MKADISIYSISLPFFTKFIWNEIFQYYYILLKQLFKRVKFGQDVCIFT